MLSSGWWRHGAGGLRCGEGEGSYGEINGAGGESVARPHSYCQAISFLALPLHSYLRALSSTLSADAYLYGRTSSLFRVGFVPSLSEVMSWVSCLYSFRSCRWPMGVRRQPAAVSLRGLAEGLCPSVPLRVGKIAALSVYEKFSRAHTVVCKDFGQEIAL